MRTFISLIVLAIIGIALYYVIPIGGTPKGGTATTTPPAATSTSSLTLAGGNIGITYPSGTYGLAVTPEQVLVHAYIPPCDTPFDYCLYRIGNDYASTTFESAGIRITRRSDLTSKDACLTTEPAGYTNLPATTTQAAEYAASVFAPVGGAAVGHYASGALYRLYAAGQCTEFETRIGQTQYANYPPGSIKEFTTADKAAVQGELESILTSVTASGAPVTFPSATY